MRASLKRAGGDQFQYCLTRTPRDTSHSFPKSAIMYRLFPPTRAAALGSLVTVIPRMGRAYAAGRNADLGPEEETATSALSPYLRRRMLLESEVVDAAMQEHGPQRAEKFIQEVFWRTYFKGYLETRPGDLGSLSRRTGRRPQPPCRRVRPAPHV